MVFNYRFFDQVKLAKKIVAERSFGAVVNFTGLVHYACWSHAIDLVHHFAGPVAVLSAIESEGTRGGRAEARDVTASMRTAGDATGTLIGTSALDWTFPLFELTLNFEGGRIHLRDLDGDVEVLDHAEGRSELHAIPKDKSRWDQYRASFARSVVAYLQSLRNGEAASGPGGQTACGNCRSRPPSGAPSPRGAPSTSRPSCRSTVRDESRLVLSSRDAADLPRAGPAGRLAPGP